MVEKNVCKTCNNELEENYNFCPYCGTALTDSAKEMLKQRDCVVNLQLIEKLTDCINDEQSLNILKKVADELKK